MTRRKPRIGGRIYKKYNRLPNGAKRYHETWTVRYKGKDYSTGTESPREAERFLLTLIGRIAEGKMVSAPSSPPMNELFDDLVNNYIHKRNTSVEDLQGRLDKHLRPFFGPEPCSGIGSSRISAYVAARLQGGAANGTVNKELAFLKRAFHLAFKHEPPKIARIPHIEMLEENNARTGFLRPAEYERLKAALPDWLRLLFQTAYHLGGRRGELEQALIADVRLDENRFFLRPQTTKTKDGRWLPLYGELPEAFARHLEETARAYPSCPWVFHREGKPITTFSSQWATALKLAGLGEDIRFHDLRRTAVRNMMRAGLRRKQAMEISGHKTEEVFERYNISDESDFLDAVRKMQQFSDKERTVVNGAEASAHTGAVGSGQAVARFGHS